MKNNRERVITEILERYHDLVDPMQSRSKTGDGVHLPLMPPTYTPTVKHIEELVRSMRQDTHPLVVTKEGKVSTRKLAWHLTAWWVTAEVVLVAPPKMPRSKRKGPQRLTLTTDGRRPKVRHIRREAGANRALAEAAVTWIADAWSAPFEPMLPDEIHALVAA